MTYIKRRKGDNEYTFRKCQRCGKAIDDDCDCVGKPDTKKASWLVYVIIYSVIIICLMVAGKVFASEWAGWSDPRKADFTPASTLRDDFTMYATPANLFESGDTVLCVAIDLEGNIVSSQTVTLNWRRLVTFGREAYDNAVLAYCRQG